MSKERDIFAAAVEIEDLSERGDFLNAACGSDLELRNRIDELLEMHDSETTFLNEDAFEHQQGFASALVGSTIGRYRLLEIIGRGGFGVVYMAEQAEPVRRRVALKVIKPGMDTDEVIARFEAERQALAMMDHPNIARVFDGGATEDGRPYFVMELVNGPPITEFCDSHRLTTNDRARLLADVCRAVQHAHQKGVIHRDIKPSNVLVTFHDGHPVPKVIDFGIAKAVSHWLTTKTLFTRFGQMIGTPLYMSPEQAERSGLDIDTRTDVYSLGALLYELLTGSPPIPRERLVEAALETIREVICTEDPPAPSSRLSTLGHGADEVSRLRATAHPTLVRTLRGELDWITMKTLEKDRERRYASANELADDLENFLNGLPVVAGPPSKAYLLRKFAQRNRRLVGTMTLLVGSLLVGSTMATAGFFAARKSARVARLNAYSADVRYAIGQPGLEKPVVSRYRNDPEVAGWELRWMDRHSREDHSMFTLPAHPAVMIDATVSGDGKYAAFGDWDGSLELWESTGKRRIAQRREEKITAVQFSPDDQLLACSTMGRVALFSVPELSERMELTSGHIVKSLSFSPDGRHLAGFRFGSDADEFADFVVWDLKTQGMLKGAPITTARDTGAYKAATCFSPDGTLLAVGSTNGLVRVVRIPKLTEIWQQRVADSLTNNSGVTALAFSPDGQLLATACGYEECDIRLWKTQTGDDAGRLVGHQEYVLDLEFDGDQLVSCSADGTIRYWSTLTLNSTKRLLGHHGEVCAIDCSNEGTLVSCSNTGIGKIWRPDDARNQAFETRLHQCSEAGGVQTSRNAVFALDSRKIYTFDRSGRVVVLDAETCEQVERIDEFGKGNSRLLMDLRGRQLVVENDGVDVWDINDRKRIARIERPKTRTSGIFLDSERSLLVTAMRPEDTQYRGGDVTVWNYEKSPVAPTKTITPPQITVSTVSPDGTRIAFGHDSGLGISVTIWNRVTGQQHTLSKPTGPVEGIGFSADGKWLVVDGAAEVAIWETEKWQLVSSLNDSCFSVSFSPDSRRMILGTDGVEIWDALNRRHLGKLSAPGTLFHARFSPDGNRVLATTLEGHLHVWNAPAWTELQP